MRPFSDRLLLAWLGGALDPARSLRLSEALAHDPDLQARLTLLAQEVEASEVDAAPSWRLPPPGLPIGMRVEVRREASMERRAPAPGDLLWVSLQPEEPGEWQLILLQRSAGVWQVVLPSHPDEVLPLASLPEDERGRRALGLTIPEGPAPALAVVLAPLNAQPDWTLTPERRWQSLQQQLSDGAIPVTVLGVDSEKVNDE